ncbi:glycosyltransferase family 2 protein [Marinomonas sp. THO17]|uniref:glycosyltransferase family 2 protein n=1 Tax=Marinomonas sp. THO17 TaxID=3149048 RepID=UPI00336BB558
MDKVTVIIPSYNHADYIDETIESCLHQNYEGQIDIVIIDDCSTDSTRQVLKKYTNYKADNRSIEVVFKESNCGINHSLNIGLEYSVGRYIQVLASDDVMCRDKIKEQVNFLENNPSFDCVYSRGYIYDGYNKIEYFLNKFKEFYKIGRALEYVSQQDWGGPLAQSGLFKVELFKDLMHIRRDYKSDDWAMIIVALRDYSVGYYDIPCFLYRNHGDNTYKKYWKTFPMRIDVASRLVDEKYRRKALSNIMLSQSEYLWNDGCKLTSIKFLLASNLICLNRNSIYVLARSLLSERILRILKSLRKI